MSTTGTSFDTSHDCSTGIWVSWTSTATSTSSANTWDSWNTNSTCSTSDTAWYSWNTPTYTYAYEPKKQTKAEKRAEKVRVARQEADRKERVKQAAIREEEKKIAEVKAKQLLLDLIGEEELSIYNETGRLFVQGNKFDYILSKVGLIKRIEKEKITDLCVHLDNRYKYPETDNVIAMKLAIENDEDNLLELANTHGSVKRPEQLPLAACSNY